MDICEKCGKRLDYLESHSYWNNQLKKGYLVALQKDSYPKPVPELKGKKLCYNCTKVEYFERHFREASEQSRTQVVYHGTVFADKDVAWLIEQASSAAQEFGYVLKQENHVKDKSGFDTFSLSVTIIFQKPQKTESQAITMEDNRPAKETEIIRETKVLVKIRCPYCKQSYDETLEKCPRCGASN
jgi:hypothetical protein